MSHDQRSVWGVILTYKATILLQTKHFLNRLSKQAMLISYSSRRDPLRLLKTLNKENCEKLVGNVVSVISNTLIKEKIRYK